MRLKSLLFTIMLLSIVGWGPFNLTAISSFFSNSIHSNPGSQSWVEQASKKIIAQSNNLDIKVLKVGLTAYVKARQRGLDDKQLLTLVDYTKPSSERRLWVIDLKHFKILFNTWVAHGKNSGLVSASSFSNAPGSLKSSLGVFVTDESYQGGNGYSLRLKGLENKINNNAYSRNIVFHGANYVSEAMAKNTGRVGHSWGCLAVSRDVVKPLINTIKNNTLVVAYYPDHNWLRHSVFI